MAEVWQQGGTRARLGLAISGGVDSMALASLCQKVVKGDFSATAPSFNLPNDSRTFPSFLAFIVDHGMRKESDLEAAQVATELDRLGISSQILRLDWRYDGDPSRLTNVETVARKLRYQAMGRACKDKGINTLLFAHHADDQHETILTRIYANYLGAGLEGMEAICNIPQCSGIYGVDHSGRPHLHDRRSLPNTRRTCRMAIESGGITIGRPLLSVAKQDLVEICQENEVKWFEDNTNIDPTLTIRNTFRHLVENDHLPLALSKDRLAEAAVNVSTGQNRAEAAASKFFNRTHSALDLRTGATTFHIPTASADSLSLDARSRAMVVRKMLNHVSCKSTISLQNLDAAVDLIFNPENNEEQPPLDVAGIDIRRTPALSTKRPESRTFTFRRQTPSKQEIADTQAVIWHPRNTTEQSDWVLWDGRYWIRMWTPGNTNTPDPDVRITVPFLTPKLIETLRRDTPVPEIDNVNFRLEKAKGSMRFTLPAIVATKPGANDKVVALPTLNWSAEGWQRDNAAVASPGNWRWDIRYKHVDLNKRLLIK